MLLLDDVTDLRHAHLNELNFKNVMSNLPYFFTYRIIHFR